MQNLRKQLLKAKLIDKKAKKRADQEASTEKRRKGHAAVDAESAARDAEFERNREQRRAEDRRREKARRAEQRAREARHQLRDFVLKNVVREGRHGPRRFHFVTRAGKIPYLGVTEELARLLEHGRVAIVEVPLAPPETYEVVERAAAERIGEVDAEAVRFWNR